MNTPMRPVVRPATAEPLGQLGASDDGSAPPTSLSRIRVLATMTGPLGQRYRCVYQVVTPDTQFYSRMVRRHGHPKVSAWVNSSM